MTLTLGSLTLVHGQSRNTSGLPVGPDNLVVRDERGVERRELVGADGVEPEWIRCDARQVEFSVTRVYATPAAALAYAFGTDPATGGGLAEGRQAAAALKADAGTDGETTIMSHASITRRESTVEGCAVAVRYVIEGW